MCDETRAWLARLGFVVEGSWAGIQEAVWSGRIGSAVRLANPEQHLRSGRLGKRTERACRLVKEARSPQTTNLPRFAKMEVRTNPEGCTAVQFWETPVRRIAQKWTYDGLRKWNFEQPPACRTRTWATGTGPRTGTCTRTGAGTGVPKAQAGQWEVPSVPRTSTKARASRRRASKLWGPSTQGVTERGASNKQGGKSRRLKGGPGVRARASRARSSRDGSPAWSTSGTNLDEPKPRTEGVEATFSFPLTRLREPVFPICPGFGPGHSDKTVPIPWSGVVQWLHRDTSCGGTGFEPHPNLGAILSIFFVFCVCVFVWSVFLCCFRRRGPLQARGGGVCFEHSFVLLFATSTRIRDTS